MGSSGSSFLARPSLAFSVLFRALDLSETLQATIDLSVHLPQSIAAQHDLSYR